MKLPHILVALTALASAAALAQPAKFPEGPIRIVVPFAPGGGVDTAARLIGKQLQTSLKVPVYVDNKPGGNGVVGGQFVRNAAPDGHTLLFSAATHVLTKQVMSNAPYDPVTDFAPIARVGEAPLLMVITPTLAPNNLGEVVAAVKKEPQKWTAALPAMGAPSHVATLMFASQAKMQLTSITYKGTAPALADVAGGHSQILVDSIISLLPMVKSGKVKAISTTSAKRSSVAPEIPTARESGYPNLVYMSWQGMWAPKDTPQDRVNFLNTAINDAVAELVRTGAYSALGIEGVSETVAQFRQYIEKDVAQGAELLQGAGFKPE
jgi:tripartite-type tricarboxylate transporter receptor subunit TctC